MDVPESAPESTESQSNRAPGGRKCDFRDAQRLLLRLVSDELFLSYVPEPEQRIWRTLTRGKVQLVRERVRLQNQIEALLEEGRVKLSSLVSDLLGARRAADPPCPGRRRTRCAELGCAG